MSELKKRQTQPFSSGLIHNKKKQKLQIKKNKIKKSKVFSEVVTKKTSYSLGVTRSDSIINEWLRVAAEVEIYLYLCRKKKKGEGKGGGGEGGVGGEGGTPEKIY